MQVIQLAAQCLRFQVVRGSGLQIPGFPVLFAQIYVKEYGGSIVFCIGQQLQQAVQAGNLCK
jgi:hypothetical protein